MADEETAEAAPGDWLSVRAAAQRREIGTDAIYKAIRRGAVAARGTARLRVVRWADVAALAGGQGGPRPGAKPAGASIRTARTAQAARQNGKLGGRPKNRPAPPPDDGKGSQSNDDANYTGRD